MNQRFREARWQDSLRVLKWLAAYILVVILSAIFLTPHMPPVGFIAWIVILAVGLVLLVKWHAGYTGYRCGHCGHDFEISTLTDLASPQGMGPGGGWKYLRCPQCDRRSRARVLVKN